ncbi:MAG: hypothetical protein P8Z34_08065 [Anaerolineales bacterium]
MMIEDCENALIPTIRILPGGMVDVALSEFGATLVDVYLDGAPSPLPPNEHVDSAPSS